MGKKYIIDIGRLERLYKAFVNAHGKPEITWLSPEVDLTPYTEPDMEQVRKRGYDKGLDDIGNALRLLLFQYSNYTLQEIFGYDTARAVVEHFEGSEIVARIRCYEGGVKQDVETIRKEAYQKGLSDAWETARKLVLDANHGGLTNYEIEEIFGVDEEQTLINYSASEAIEEIRAHEQAQKEKEELEKEQSVTAEEVMRQYLDKFCKGRSCTGCILYTSDFTCGRGYHFLCKNSVSDKEVRRAYAKVVEEQ